MSLTRFIVVVVLRNHQWKANGSFFSSFFFESHLRNALHPSSPNVVVVAVA